MTGCVATTHMLIGSVHQETERWVLPLASGYVNADTSAGGTWCAGSVFHVRAWPADVPAST